MARGRLGQPPLSPGAGWAFSPELAKAIGLDEAVVLERIWQLAHAGAPTREHGGLLFVRYLPRDMADDFAFTCARPSTGSSRG